MSSIFREQAPTVLSILFVITLLAASPSGAGNSVWTGGLPFGGYLEDVVLDPTDPATAFVATAIAGVFKSVDGGVTWAPTAPGAPLGTRDLSIAADGTLFVAGEEEGVARTTDSGASWTVSTSGLEGLLVSAVAVAPTDASVVYAGTAEDGVRVSTDGGVTFADIAVGLPANAAVNSLAVSPMAPATAWVGLFGEGVYVTSDSGANWVPQTSGIGTPTIVDIVVAPSLATTLYAATSSDQIYGSTDGGASWSDVSTGLTGSLRALSVAPDDSMQALAVGADGVFFTFDGGGLWSPIDVLGGKGGRGVALGVLDLRGPGVRRGVAVTEGGAWSSTDPFLWTETSTGLAAHGCDRPLVPPGPFGVAYSCGKWKTSDGGGTWIEQPFDLFEHLVNGNGDIALSSPDTLYFPVNDKIYRTDNGGATWASTIVDPLPFGALGPIPVTIAVTPTDAERILVGNFSSVFGGTPQPALLLSTNGGADFTHLYTPPDTGQTSFRPRSLVIDPTDPSVLLAASFIDAPTPSANVLRSADGGTTWTETLSVADSSPHLVMAPSDSSVLYAAFRDLDDAAASGTIYRSADNGVSWTEVGAGAAPCARTLAIDPDDATRVFLACDRMYESTDSGATWTLFDTTGIPATVANFRWITIAGDTEKTFVADTNGGVYFYTDTLFADGFESGDTSGWSLTASP